MIFVGWVISFFGAALLILSGVLVVDSQGNTISAQGAYNVSKKEKRLQKIRQNPKNVSFDELKQVLEDWGFSLVRSKGTHNRFEGLLQGKVYAFTIPFHRPVKAAYVIEVLSVIDILKEEEHGDSDDPDEPNS